MQDDLVRIGVIYPVGGGELDYFKFAEETDPRLRMYLVSTRLYGDDEDHDIECLLKSGDVKAMAIAGAKLKAMKPNAMIWCCTSGSFVGGLAWSRDQAAAIGKAADCPATTTSLAFVSALDHLQCRKIAIMASYPPMVAARFAEFLAACEKEIVNLHALDIISGWDAALIGDEAMIDAVRAADHPDADAVLIPDTALPTLHLIRPLEAMLGKPVLTANQVSIWECLRLAGESRRREDLGQLFSA